MNFAFRNALKQLAMGTLRSAGVYSRSARSGRRSNRLLILCYHGISLHDEHQWAGHLFITAERFRQRLACLRDLNASVLSLGDGLARLRAGSLPPCSVVITFDDGFYDFLKGGVPVLSEFGFPCTLYLTTYYSGLPFPIINLALDYLLWKSGRRSVAFPEWGIAHDMPISDWKERAAVVRALLRWIELAEFDTQGKDNFARLLAGRFGIDYDELLRSRFAQILTPEEAAQVSRAGVDIELHTHRHRTPKDHALFVKEIEDNRSRITEATGKAPVHFCYPSGHYDPDFLRWLTECGVQSATTCERGLASPSVDRFVLPRVLDDSNMSLLEFEGLVSGLFA